MLLNYLKHILEEIKTDFDKKGNLGDLDEKIDKLYLLVVELLRNKCFGKTDQEIVYLIENTNYDPLNEVLADLQLMARTKTESNAF